MSKLNYGALRSSFRSAVHCKKEIKIRIHYKNSYKNLKRHDNDGTDVEFDYEGDLC